MDAPAHGGEAIVRATGEKRAWGPRLTVIIGDRRSLKGSVSVRGRERFEHEHFDREVGVEVVIAHEADHLRPVRFSTSLRICVSITRRQRLRKSRTALPPPVSASV